MVDAVAFLLLTSVASLPGDADVSRLPQLFIAACLDGQARLSPGSAEPISFGALPDDIRQRLGEPASGQVWRLNGSGQAFLYVLDYAGGRNANRRICGIGSDELNYRDAADAVEMRVTGAVYPKSRGSIQWMDPKGGFRAFVTRAGKFNVLQVNWLSDAERAAAIASYAPIMP